MTTTSPNHLRTFVARVREQALCAGQNVAAPLTYAVAGLASPAIVPDDRINEAARLGWQLIGSRVCPAVIQLDVPSLHFGAVRRRGSDRNAGVIFLPKRWLTLVERDPLMQIGAVAFTLAQVRDYWNAFLLGGPSPRRAEALEARFLRACEARGVGPLNGHQRKVVADFPEGGADDAWYEGLPFDYTRACDTFEGYEGVALREPTTCPDLVAADGAFA